MFMKILLVALCPCQSYVNCIYIMCSIIISIMSSYNVELPLSNEPMDAHLLLKNNLGYKKTGLLEHEVCKTISK